MLADTYGPHDSARIFELCGRHDGSGNCPWQSHFVDLGMGSWRVSNRKVSDCVDWKDCIAVCQRKTLTKTYSKKYSKSNHWIDPCWTVVELLFLGRIELEGLPLGCLGE
jgi:hypothetical protein